MIVAAMFFDFKTMHPEWQPEVGETKELIKAAVVCSLVFLCPVLNIVFAYFCMVHQRELRDELFKKLEEELREQNYYNRRA